MFTIYVEKDKLKFCSELIILGGLLDTILERDTLRMKGLIDFCKENIIYSTDIKKCNVIVLPYKLQSDKDPYLKKLSKLGKKYNKKVLTFFIDDSNKKFLLPKNCIVYRTSFSDVNKLKNERSIMPLVDDLFRCVYLNMPALSIGFCGQINCNRKMYLKYFYLSGLKTDFILRKATYFGSSFTQDKQQARDDYIKNMENNIFIFNYRGYGNYSYRYYETLMMGRIPILVNTNCVIPYFDETIKDGISVIIVDESDFLKDENILKEKIEEFYKKNYLIMDQLQKKNRYIYEKYYTCNGFITNLINEYK